MGEHSKPPWEVIQFGDPPMFEIDNGKECLAQGVLNLADAKLMAAAPALLESLKETRDAAAELMRAIFNSGHSDAVISLLDPRYAGFGVRADRAIKLATELSHGLDV